ncbi:tRNA 2-thiouridine(34) synthase MnmA [Microvirga sp. W0021]|uniref:tRNA-specific 2-thiouridylase MnmA n=1 Tax=Hohaiivirga grylli TaxID=3133970 RepID=A0ABV0BGE3_9HYPH
MNSLGLPRAPGDTRVVVAMSGGVDSSVVAAMLKKEGYDVIGITLQLYDHGDAIHRKGACCAGQDIHDARRVAEAINIPHYVLDYEDRFRQEVIDRFAESYLSGETPIPCVECNRSIKFRDLLKTAKELGADILATGHYIVDRALPNGKRGLFRAADPHRDQSYFLYATTPEQLEILRFPLGELKTKEETRAMARELGLSVAEKADSQDICFVPEGKYSDIIERLKPGAVAPGDVVHIDGRVLGQHEGIIHYTVGQRRGLKLATGEPLYVIKLDAEKGQVIVGPREALATKTIRINDINWLGDELPGPEGMEVAVRVRSTREPRPAILRFTENGAEAELLQSEDGVSPGQACVIYDSEDPRARLLGGGTILRNEPVITKIAV